MTQREAAQELRCARRVVFVGYSFPEADVHLKALFRKNIHGHAEVIVVNRSINDRLEESFRSIGKDIQFREMTFEAFLENDELLDAVFAGGTDQANR